MIRRIAGLVCVVVATGSVRADDGSDYVKTIKPLLAARCVNCHGPLRQRGGLRLDAGVLIRKGGDSGPAIVAGKPKQSLLLHALTGSNDATQMPEDGKPLKAKEIALIRRWIEQGATFPQGEKIAADPRDHWAFKRPVRPLVPRVKNAGWVKNPIDAFIAAQQEKRGLKPQSQAEKSVLLRRVFLDLIGLPPLPEQLQAFLADDSTNAYEKVVDELLRSPRYGERWGRHWMDVWRYSDWYGYRKELRNSARHIWRWRDWIIESLNEDRPYDQMVADMIAADEIAPADAKRLRATGFLARHYYKFNRNTWLDGVIEHSGKAFLGMTFNCARCHDHKFDPISQREYYRLRAIFEPYRVRTRRIAGQPDVTKDGIAVAYDADLKVKTFVFARGNDKYPDKEHPVSAGVPDILGSKAFKITPVQLPPRAWYPGFRPEIRAELLKKADALVKQRKTALRQAEQLLQTARRKRSPQKNAAKLRPVKGKGAVSRKPRSKSASKILNPVLKTKAAELKSAQAAYRAAQSALASLRARIAADDARFAQPPAANGAVLSRDASRAEKRAGLHQAEADLFRAESALQKSGRSAKARAAAVKLQTAARKKLSAAKAALKKSGQTYSPITKTHPRTSSGRRRALARWIASRRNPLTARVAVNHIWMRHFGRPLVPTVFEFGQNGKPATHPHLLDWLAVEFMENGWSMKKLHRLMVTSNTYRMSSSRIGSAAVNQRTIETIAFSGG